MQRLLSKLTYANVIATIALFLALGSGAAIAAGKLGKNAVKSTNIAANAVKTKDIARNAVKASKLAANAVKAKNLAANAVKEKNLAKNSVSGGKVKSGTLTRTQLAAGTLAGLQVADAQATSVPGVTSAAPDALGTEVPLSGTAAFTPVAGKSYVLLAELRGTPSDANGPVGGECFAWVRISVNGEPIASVEINANANAVPPFALNAADSASTGIGLLSTGPQTITASSFGSTNCGAETTASLRVTVVELG